MAKPTLLEMVQFVAKKIGSDEISALAESVEATEIEEVVREVLEDIVTRTDWEFLKDRLGVLEDGATVISLNIPANVSKLQTVRYNKTNDDVRTLTYLDPQDYLHRMQKLKATEPNTTTVVVNGATLVAKTNQDPRFWTILDEIVFVDAYDSSRDTSGVVGAQSVILFTEYFDFTGDTSPTWVAPIPEKLVALWKQEATAEAASSIARDDNPRAERRARRQYVKQQRSEPVFKRDEGGTVNYGR